MGETVTEVEVAPPMGCDVSPELPTNHWYVRLLPVAVTESCVDCPEVMLLLAGCVVIPAFVQVTVTVAVLLFVEDPPSQLLLTRTQ